MQKSYLPDPGCRQGLTTNARIPAPFPYLKKNRRCFVISSRFSNITEQYGSPQEFLDKLEKINGKMEAYYKGMDDFKEGSFAGRIQKALGRDPFTRMEAYKQAWRETTGQLHPFISDKDGNRSYLSSFLEENRLKSHIHTDFYHVPESQTCNAYASYESDCTLGHSWLVKRDAAVKLEHILPQKADLWTHICHSGAKDIAESGIAINTGEDAGRVNLERNLNHYGDMGHVMTALNVGIRYKGATNVFLCDIADEEEAKVSISADKTGYVRSCNLSPEHICAILTVEDGKITDACTRDEFLDKFRENEIDSPWKEPKYRLEHELEISMDIGGRKSRMEQGMALEEDEMEL